MGESPGVKEAAEGGSGHIRPAEAADTVPASRVWRGKGDPAEELPGGRGGEDEGWISAALPGGETSTGGAYHEHQLTSEDQ